MSKIKEKKNEKKLIIMIVIIMLFNFAMPNYSFALESGGVIFEYFTQIILIIPDLLLNKLQSIFISEDADIASINPEGGVSHYSITYSPGMIFSGQIAGMDINFISEGTKGQVTTTWAENEYKQVTELPNGEKKKDFTIEDLEEYFDFNEEKAQEDIANSDTSSYIFGYRKRSCKLNMGK